ncbi:hypothetical protein D6817_02980, partial [Candidatus Pacearchaeota archaeon]
ARPLPQVSAGKSAAFRSLKKAGFARGPKEKIHHQTKSRALKTSSRKKVKTTNQDKATKNKTFKRS